MISSMFPGRFKTFLESLRGGPTPLKDIESYRMEDLFNKFAIDLQDEVFADAVLDLDVEEDDPEFERAYTTWTTDTFSPIVNDLRNWFGEEVVRVRRGSDGETEGIKFLKTAEIPEELKDKWREKAVEFVNRKIDK